jgi:sigma-B regulation protein RsbU (phosphoserine phosphatase)
MRDEIPQMLISGWSLPEVNGPELCRIIKSNEYWKSIYFIILSSKATLKDRIAGLDFGADDFIVKPVENQELLARIRTGIRLYNLQKEFKKTEHDKALLEMACTIGHQINNPLNSLICALDSLKGMLKNEQNEDIQLIEKSLARIKNLASNLRHIKDPELVDYIPGTKMLKL